MTPLTVDVGVERNASFSPDGTQVVYEWETEDHRRHIYVKVVGPGDPIALTSGTSVEFGPAWSPDGRLIAFLRQTEPTTVGLYVVPPLGGVERKLADAAAPGYWVLHRFVRRLAWTVDSSRVIVSVPDRFGHGEGLLSVSVADGGKTWLTDPKAEGRFGDREPAVSPDGQWVAFARGEVAASEAIYLLPLMDGVRAAGTAQPLPAAGRARSPAWSPDGTEVLFTGVNPAMAFQSGIWRVRIERHAVPLPIDATGPATGVPAVSRTGRLVYSRITMESSIWRQDIPQSCVQATRPERLTNASAVDFNAQYSPDGRRIAFASNRSGWRESWTCDSLGSHCQAATSFRANYVTGTPRWSPDGRQIAFESGASGRVNIYVVDADGGAPRRLTDDQTNGVVPSWSRDGKWIYFSSSRTGANEIWKIPSGGGAAVQVTSAGGFNANESPDGNTLYYTKNDERADLFRSQTDGSGERFVLRGVAKRGFVVTKDRIYYIRADTEIPAELRAFVLRTGEDIPIAEISEPLFMGLSVSPNGRSLIYSQMRITSSLMLAEGVFC